MISVKTTNRVRRAVYELSLVSMAATLMLATLGCKRHGPSDHEISGEASDSAWFEEVARDSGLTFLHQSGHEEAFWFPEIMAGGVCLIDYDGDGFLDIYMVQSGTFNENSEPAPRNQLYRNQGDGTFENATPTAGVGDDGYGVGCACGDYDNDGDTDLYVTNVGSNVLYRNEGDGTFTNVTQDARVGDASWGTSAAFVDVDRDGLLDLYVANYVNWSKETERDCFLPNSQKDYCGPSSYSAPARDTLYRNLGGGRFVDASVTAGVRAGVGQGLGVAVGDFNQDGWVDVYVANDNMMNHLWINDGQGRLTDEAMKRGCALNQFGAVEAGMGVAAVDVENDGDLDLFMSHLRGETNTFYVNRGGVFEDVSATIGLASPSFLFTGFGLGFADFDHDGELDVYVANGRVVTFTPYLDPNDHFAEPNQLFRGLGNGQFEEVVPGGGTTQPLIATSRGAAFGDLDNDGDIDVVVANKDASPHLLRNVIGDRGHWVMFRVVGVNGSDAVGSSVRIETDGRVWWRQVQPAYSYGSSNDPRVHCGLASQTQVDRVTVRWPNGQEETFGPFPADRQYELRFGKGRSSQ